MHECIILYFRFNLCFDSISHYWRISDSLLWRSICPPSNKVCHFFIHHAPAVNLGFLSVSNDDELFLHSKRGWKSLPYTTLPYPYCTQWYEFVWCQIATKILRAFGLLTDLVATPLRPLYFIFWAQQTVCSAAPWRQAFAQLPSVQCTFSIQYTRMIPCSPFCSLKWHNFQCPKNCVLYCFYFISCRHELGPTLPMPKSGLVRTEQINTDLNIR